MQDLREPDIRWRIASRQDLTTPREERGRDTGRDRQMERQIALDRQPDTQTQTDTTYMTCNDIQGICGIHQ